MNKTSKNYKRKSKKATQSNLRFLSFIIICGTLIILGSICIKNSIITKKCKDSLYSIDYYLTHNKNKNLRLVKVDSIAVIEQEKNHFTIEAIGTQVAEPYKEITVIASFSRNKKGTWNLLSVDPVSNKDNDSNENNNTTNTSETD